MYIAIQAHSNVTDLTGQWTITKHDNTKFKIDHLHGACVLDKLHLHTYLTVYMEYFSDSGDNDIAILNDFGLPNRYWTAEQMADADFDIQFIFRALDILQGSASASGLSSETSSSDEIIPTIDLFINEEPHFTAQKGESPTTFTVHNNVHDITCSFDIAVYTLWLEAALDLEEAYIDEMFIANNFGLPSCCRYDGIDLDLIKRYFTIMLSCENIHTGQ